MTRKEFIKEFAQKAELTIKDATEITRIFGEVLIEHMNEEGGVRPFDGMSFKRYLRSERNYTNPQTGDVVKVPSHYVPKVTFGKIVKDAVK